MPREFKEACGYAWATPTFLESGPTVGFITTLRDSEGVAAPTFFESGTLTLNPVMIFTTLKELGLLYWHQN